MVLAKLILFGALGYAAYAYYQGRAPRMRIALTIATAAGLFWLGRTAIRWIENFQS